jgi:hypothetical protein
VSAPKHTPGPWSRSWIAGAIRHINRNVDSDAFWSPTEEEAKDLDAVNHPTRNDADYDLIAAAPDLLDACVRLLHHSGPCDAAEMQDRDFARAAIAKAEGKK